MIAEVTPSACRFSSSDFMGLAKSFVAEHPFTIRRHQEQWWYWNESNYKKLNKEHLETELWHWIDDLDCFKPTPSIVNGTMKALAAVTQTPMTAEMPCYIGHRSFPHPDSIIAFSNGLLDLETLRFLNHTPDWLSATCLPHPYDTEAACPTWDRFLDEVFGGDAERVRSLAQWFGYNLTRDTSQQKFVLMVGPPGSGKSTTLKVLGEMLGEDNVATPSLTMLWRFYGMETIAGKLAALIGDAHLENQSKAIAILEKLKSIVGCDRQNVDRKGRQELANVVIKARFTLAVNELPQFPDSSASLRRRLLVLPFNRSFAGTEDTGLFERLRDEMPGITNWALKGLYDLRESGRLFQPKAGDVLIKDFTLLGSPVKEFLDDCCEVSSELTIRCDTLWGAWVGWCKHTGHKAMDRSRFGELLRSAVPAIERIRHLRDEEGKQIRFYRGVKLK